MAIKHLSFLGDLAAGAGGYQGDCHAAALAPTPGGT